MPFYNINNKNKIKKLTILHNYFKKIKKSLSKFTLF